MAITRQTPSKTHLQEARALHAAQISSVLVGSRTQPSSPESCSEGPRLGLFTANQETGCQRRRRREKPAQRQWSKPGGFLQRRALSLRTAFGERSASTMTSPRPLQRAWHAPCCATSSECSRDKGWQAGCRRGSCLPGSALSRPPGLRPAKAHRVDMSSLLQTCLPCWQVERKGLDSFPSHGRAPSPSLERRRTARGLPLLPGSCQGPDRDTEIG
ncbi:PREDICTED: uncharacterized protein LOC104994908 [Bison bison bison]|uniref:Uncharacterized protein LOC104994908 n=1 Tax=Bison bison bison TaxID=43346 RepID=A0A6P3HWK3_BISBB|nr:PREDICTED: uncharacterized protein LOC104994908 [Bison bison bison]XP_010846919.1 PREDICTED: uncharacterized protein LOC104994908 [Bison bison bison]